MKQSVRRLVAVLLLGGLLVCSAAAVSFLDVSTSASYAKAVEYVSNAGIMIGDNYGNFNPNKTVTRAEMATIVCRMLGEEPDSTEYSSFIDDVSTSHWACGYISKAAYMGIVPIRKDRVYIGIQHRL